ncbi:MAG: winged helix-turn-helix domain-containing protein [Acidobacteria bacterium]|nr:winged helix-turn-helix domain-containing protein [Acidobacteriota bacterium]
MRLRPPPWHSRDLGLSTREIEVLRYLAERASRLVTRDELLQAVWGFRDVPLTRSVDICIARLRRKIEDDPHRPVYLRTAHGTGYVLTTLAES